MDITRIINDLLPAPDGESPLRHRTGTITVVNSDGTVDLDLGGQTVEDVQVLVGSQVAVGDVVQVAAWSGDLLVLGRVAVSDTEIIRPGLLLNVQTNTAANTISTTETVEETATVTIPTYWDGYFLEAMATFDSLESGTLTAIRTMTFRLRRTNLAGAVLQLTEPSIGTVQPNRQTHALLGYSQSQTGTGAQSVVFTTEIGGDSGQASTDNLVFSLKAFRTA